MQPNKSSHQSFRFTTTEEVSLPANDSPGLGIRARDWKNLKRAVGKLSSSNGHWETAFTISVSVFLSFLLPALTTSGPIKGWKAAFWTITLLSFGISTASFFGSESEKSNQKTDKQDVLDLMGEIESLYDQANRNKTSTSPGNLATSQKQEEELFESAVKLAIEAGKVSTSFLQRRLRIGYSRAARIVEDMEKMGLVGPNDGARPRSVLVKQPDQNLPPETKDA